MMMPKIQPFRFAILILATCCMLSACGSSDDSAKPDADKDKEKASTTPKAKTVKVDPICPQVGVVRELETFKDFGGETPAANQLVAAAKLTGVDGDCAYTDDGVDVSFNVNIVAKRGPRLGGRHASFPFFIAVVDPSGKVLNKNQTTADISFASDSNIANDAEPMHVMIPLAKSKRSTGPYYKVLAGFQLNPEQAEQAKVKLKP